MEHHAGAAACEARIHAIAHKQLSALPTGALFDREPIDTPDVTRELSAHPTWRFACAVQTMLKLPTVPVDTTGMPKAADVERVVADLRAAEASEAELAAAIAATTPTELLIDDRTALSVRDALAVVAYTARRDVELRHIGALVKHAMGAPRSAEAAQRARASLWPTVRTDAYTYPDLFMRFIDWNKVAPLPTAGRATAVPSGMLAELVEERVQENAAAGEEAQRTLMHELEAPAIAAAASATGADTHEVAWKLLLDQRLRNTVQPLARTEALVEQLARASARADVMRTRYNTMRADADAWGKYMRGLERLPLEPGIESVWSDLAQDYPRDPAVLARVAHGPNFGVLVTAVCTRYLMLMATNSRQYQKIVEFKAMPKRAAQARGELTRLVHRIDPTLVPALLYD